MSDFIKAEKVVSTALGLLLRDLTLPNLVWRDAAGDFAGVKDDTITIRLPAYAPARTRALRAAGPITADDIHERSVDVTLATDVYKRINITDEAMTLDIADFGRQVLTPVLTGIGLELENQLSALITAASYENSITYNLATGDVWTDLVLPARSYLNNAFVPFAGRRIVVGSEIETAMLSSEQFIRADHSGASALSVFHEAQIGRVGGFDVYSSPALEPDEAYAFHQTAYVMSQRAPVVPDGAPWGAVQAYEGFALRVAKVFDPDYLRDQFVANAYVGTNTVKDFGHYTDDPDLGGKFVPATDPAAPITGHSDTWLNDSARLVRAVKVTAIAS